MKKVLVVEPYFGGSHKQFLLGLQKHIEADFTFLTLPARKWKMRMQLSAPWFASCIEKMENRFFDTVLCSTFVDVAVLKALVVNLENWNVRSRFCTYFHENQFVYPVRQEERVRNPFTTINLTTALVSDKLGFNSKYNWESFITNSFRFIKNAADIDLRPVLQKIEEKTDIIYPGVDFEYFTGRKEHNTIPVICWNHRWEHDKDPESFFRALAEVEERGYDFRIMVLGQAFRDIPEVFISSKARFAEKILHFGYAASRKDYIDLLEKCDIVISTALHEFFGISVIEALRAGCIPLLPNNLSYPELYPEEYLYADGQLADRLSFLLDEFASNPNVRSHSINTDRFSWQTLADRYEKWLFAL
jgi:glycosyltransferase involved in cell wall biosynthesis